MSQRMKAKVLHGAVSFCKEEIETTDTAVLVVVVVGGGE